MTLKEALQPLQGLGNDNVAAQHGSGEDPDLARAGWSLTADRIANNPEGLDPSSLLDRIELEMAGARPEVQWTMNYTLAAIGIDEMVRRQQRRCPWITPRSYPEQAAESTRGVVRLRSIVIEEDSPVATITEKCTAEIQEDWDRLRQIWKARYITLPYAAP